MPTMTALRSTPNLSVPATQNTAPVFEFRCLWTQDLRKKKKTWHDGSLRFHTFNRRLMVYDDQKNFIGDAHWRSNSDLQEGDELSLDRGALIEVGERIGSTVTDLVPLRETVRQHPERVENNVPQASRLINQTSTPWISATRSQWQPKSLSAVLGNSQGPIGRARVPTKSPFQQKEENLQLHDSMQGSPLKRLRLTAGEENRPPFGKPAEPGRVYKSPRQAQMVADQRPQPSSSSIHQSPRISNSTVSSSVLDRPTAVEGCNRLLVQSREPYKPPETASRTHTALLRSGNSQLRATTNSKLNIGKEVQERRKDHSASASLPRQNKINDLEGPKTRLRFSKQPPRRKLMDRSLLLQKSTASEGVDKLTDYGPRERNTANRSTKRRRRESEISAVFGSPSLSQRTLSALPPLEASISPSYTTPGFGASPKAIDNLKTGPSPHTEALDSAILISSSPEPPPSRSPTPEHIPRSRGEESAGDLNDGIVDVSEADMDLDSSEKGHSHANSSRIPSPGGSVAAKYSPYGPRSCKDGSLLDGACVPSNGGSTVDESKLIEAPLVTPPKTSQGALHTTPTTSRLALLDQQLFSWPSPQAQHKFPSPIAQETPQPRPFRRVVSENDSLGISLHDQPILRKKAIDVKSPSLPQASARQILNTRRAPSRSPIKLQKAKSLSEIIEATTAKAKLNSQLLVVAEEASHEERGPWTTHEAWDLFECWPDGRQRPKYGDFGGCEDEQADYHTTVSGDKRIEQPLKGFVSAINVL